MDTTKSLNHDQMWDYYQTALPELFTGAEARLHFLVEQIRQWQPTAQVLDIGVGDGGFERLAKAAGLDIFCLDPSEASIAEIRRTLQLGPKAQVGYSQALPFEPASFDAVVLSEVIEHLSDAVLTQTIPEVQRVLRKGGRIFVTVPAREKLANAQIVCPHCQQHFHRWGHQQSFTPERLSALFAPYFRIETLLERPFVNWPTLNWKGKVIHFSKLTLWKLGVHGAGENIYLCGSKG